MATYNVHAGHNSIVPGANKYLNEVTEDRAVKSKVISYLKATGNTAYDCTDDSGRTQDENLSNIVKKCNAHSVDLDVSIHLNSGRKDSKGDGKTGGVEVLCYDEGTKEVAKAIADAIHNEFGYTLRSDETTPDGYAGVKIKKDLYVLRNTKAPAILIECCFVDDKDDAKVWNSDKCAKAIVKGITGKAVSSGSNTGAASSAASSDHGGTPGHYWATVQLKELDRTSGQKWIAHKHSDGTYSIKSVATGIYLSVRDGKMTNGQEVWAYSWNNTKSQRFFIDLDESGEIASEAHIRCYYDKNKVVEVQSGSHADGARIQIYNDNDTYAQKWTFLPTGHEEEYYIINFGSGKALDVKYK